eukprot:1223897-Ditylum_brightwellii.AAC.1
MMRLFKNVLRNILNMPVGNSPIFDGGAFLKITVMFQLRHPPPPTIWETELMGIIFPDDRRVVAIYALKTYANTDCVGKTCIFIDYT